MVSESEHEVVVERLEEIMQNDAQFTPSVLDALSNLNLREELLTRVHDSVMPRLGPSAPAPASPNSPRSPALARACLGCLELPKAGTALSFAVLEQTPSS